MTSTLKLGSVVRQARQDYLRNRRTLLVFVVFFKVLEALVAAQAVAIVLRVLLAGTGQVAVSNFDILDFLLTPAGALYAAMFAIVALAAPLLEQAGIMVIGSLGERGKTNPGRPALATLLWAILRVVKLGAIKALLVALTLAPFTALVLLVYFFFLTEQDIYFYLRERPPVFWVAGALGGLILAAAAAAGLWLYVQWSFALPILLFEHQPAAAALRLSRQRVRGAGWRIAALLLGWQTAALTLGLVLVAGYRFLARIVVEKMGLDNSLVLFLLVLGQAGFIALLSFIRVTGQGLFTRRLYLQRSIELGVAVAEYEPAAEEQATASPWPRRIFLVWLFLLLLSPLVQWRELVRFLRPLPPVGVTAHRGHARAAPENTLSALRKAMESGADYAEIDVHLTADGKLVLLHDRDLLRVAGDPRRLSEVTLAEVKTLDVGRWFSPSFAGERAPTLAEAMELVRGRMKLHIELKVFEPPARLARAVVDQIRDKGFTDECIVASLNQEAIREVQRLDPTLRTGLIVAQALGDLSRLKVDVLSVRADHLTDALLRQAHRRGREVHAWTVNDPVQMALLMKRGVDNILTSDPDVLVRVRERVHAEGGMMPLTFAARLMLGMGV
jgi:glycerophosphoryl diester phosphodiesterase